MLFLSILFYLYKKPVAFCTPRPYSTHVDLLELPCSREKDRNKHFCWTTTSLSSEATFHLLEYNFIDSTQTLDIKFKNMAGLYDGDLSPVAFFKIFLSLNLRWHRQKCTFKCLSGNQIHDSVGCFCKTWPRPVVCHITLHFRIKWTPTSFLFIAPQDQWTLW